MMDDEQDRIDLTLLDPSRDRAHWNALVDSITRRALLKQRARSSVTGQLAAWARPTLAVAAALCLLVWASALTWQRRANQDAVDLMSSWASSSELPGTSNILDAFEGAADGSR
jgi:hypothetical protein